MELAGRHLVCSLIAFLHLRMHIMTCFPQRSNTPGDRFSPYFSTQVFFFFYRLRRKAPRFEYIAGLFLTVCGNLWDIWNEILDGCFRERIVGWLGHWLACACLSIVTRACRRFLLSPGMSTLLKLEGMEWKALLQRRAS